jgi:cellulose synthase operon protein C
MAKPLNLKITAVGLVFVSLLAGQLAGCGSPDAQAQRYYESGEKFLAAHDDAKAAVEFRNALRLKKDMLPAWRGLAQAEEATHHWADVAAALRAILDLDPKDLTTRIKLARLYLVGGASDQALKLINDPAVSDTNNATVLALKAAISYKLKDSPTAVADAQQALKIDPTNVEALLVLAADRLDNNDPNGALQLLSTNPQIQDQDVGTQLFKLKIYAQLKNYAEAEKLLKNLVDRFPQNLAFRQDLINLYLSQHRPDDAEKELRALVARDPKNIQFGLDLIKFLYDVKKPAAARDEIVARINAGGDIFPYQLALAEFDFDEGQASDSFKLLETLTNSSNSAQAVTAKIMLAQLNVRQRNFDAAEALANDILSTDQRNVDALKIRASIRLDRNHVDSAIEDLREALNDQPRSPELMIMLASAYERSGSIDLSDKEFADALKASNFNPVVGLDYVAFLGRRGRADRAYDILTELANRWPSNVQILSALAEARLQRQDWAGAEQVGEHIKGLGNASATSNQILGAALSGEHKYDASIAAFQDAVTAAPSAQQPLAGLVGAMVAAKQNDKAIAYLQSTLKNDPNNAEADVLLGKIEFANNAIDPAEKDFKAAIAAQPKNDSGYQALADLYLNQKKTDEALAVVQSGLKEQPDSAGLGLTLAGIFELKGDYEGAILQDQSLLKQHPGSLIVINNLASLLADHRTDKASLEQAETLAASLQDSQIAQFKDTLGWVYDREGDYRASIPLLEEAAARLPDSALVHYHLGMSYVGTGQIAKASQQLKEALGKNPDSDLQVKIKAGLKNIATQ